MRMSQDRMKIRTKMRLVQGNLEADAETEGEGDEDDDPKWDENIGQI